MEAQLSQMEIPTDKFIVLFGKKISVERTSGSGEGSNSSAAMGREHVGDLRHDGFACRLVTRKARKIMISMLNEPWLSFCEVPLDVKDRMFNEFKSSYWWRPETEISVWNSWNACLTRRLSHMYCQGRKKSLKEAETTDLSKTKSFPPRWCKKRVWAKLVDFWCTDEWQKRSKTALKNRMKKKEGATSRHNGRSLATTYRMRVERQKEKFALQQQLAAIYGGGSNGGEGPSSLRRGVGGGVAGESFMAQTEGGAANRGFVFGSCGGRKFIMSNQQLGNYAAAAARQALRYD